MKWKIKEISSEIRMGDLNYIQDEHSFLTQHTNFTATTTILFNDVHIEVDEKGRLGPVWGYCPLTDVKKTDYYPKKSEKKDIFILLEEPFIPGVSHRIGVFNVYVNPEKKWICLGDLSKKPFQMIEFAPGTVMAIGEHEPSALWLFPQKFPKISALILEGNI